VLFQGRRRVDRDERFLVAAHASAVIREVCLVCNGTPVVFAHSVVAADALRGPWRAIAGLGTRPLGAALFADHRVRRYPLRQQKLGRGHELYRRACAVLGDEPPVLWARRSVFALGNSPILVTEVFLPSILDL
jgi:chorismate lyase